MKTNTLIGGYPEQKFKNRVTVGITEAFKLSGKLDNAADGALIHAVNTTTQIIKGVVETKFYELNGQKLSDFCPIEVGTGAYSTDLFQYSSTVVSSGSGKVNVTGSGVGKVKHVDVKFGDIPAKNTFYRNAATLSREGMMMAAKQMVPFDLLEQKTRAMKKVYDLELQDDYFYRTDGNGYGLLNQPNAIIDVSYTPTTIEKMNDEQFIDWVGKLRSMYDNATSGAFQFNRLCLTSSAYWSLDKVFTPTVAGLIGYSTRKDYVESILNANDGKIVYAKYGQTIGTGAGQIKSRYALYNTDEDNIQAGLPLPYTIHPPFPQGSMDLIVEAEAQYITPVLKRDTTMIYLDNAG